MSYFADLRRTPAFLDCLGITICAVLIAALLRPFQNTPFVDDWAYAWSVEHLLRTGEMRILDWSTSINIVQVAWGALFCVPFGFSFTAQFRGGRKEKRSVEVWRT